MMMHLTLVFIFSLFLTFVLTAIAKRVALKFNILDYPNSRKIHQQPIPLLGGAAVAISFIVAVLIFKDYVDRQVYAILFGGLIILIVGLFDDMRKLSAGFRLLVQFLVVIMLIANSITLTIFPKTEFGILLRCLITIFWFIGLMNAMNFIDGIDGLCAGLAAISSLSFAVIAFFTNQPQILFLSIVIFGCCLGFFPFNYWPAKIFLGDSGSTFLGYILAVIAVIGVWAQDRVVGISIPVLILSVPIFDMVFITIMRIKEKKVSNVKEWLDYVGKDHFHHRLVYLGLSTKGVTFFIYLTSVCLSISAMALVRATWKIAILLLIQAAAVFVMVGVLMVVGGHRKSSWDAQKEAKG